MGEAEPGHQEVVGTLPERSKNTPLGRHLRLFDSRPNQSQVQQPLLHHRGGNANQRLRIGEGRPEGTPHGTFRLTRIEPKCQRTGFI